MTSLASRWHRLHRLEDLRRDLLASDGAAAEASNNRFHLGVPTDDDLEVFDPKVSSGILYDLERAFSTDGRSWDEQLAAAPAERLALDAASYGLDRAELHDALRALRRLAATGDYHTKTGWKRAAPAQRSIARILLRRVVRIHVSNDARAAASTPTTPPDRTP